MSVKKIAACLLLLLACNSADGAPRQRFKTDLVSRFYLGAAGEVLFNDSKDVMAAVGPGNSVSDGFGFESHFMAGYQHAWGWGLEAGWSSLARIIFIESPYFYDERLTFSEKTWYIEPMYRQLFGRRFTLGLGVQLGLTDSRVTENLAYSGGLSFDYRGSGWVVKPEIRTQVLAGGMVGFEFAVGYRIADASPIKDSDGQIQYNYSNSGKQDLWHIQNTGLTLGFGINVFFGRLTTRAPASTKGKVLIPLEIEGAENLPPVRQWTLQVLNPKGKLIKEFEGEGPIPKTLRWSPVDSKGRELELDEDFKLRLSTVDSFGAESTTEGSYGGELRPRAFQMASPLLAGVEDGKGSLLIATQFKSAVPGVKAWKLKIRDEDGKLLKTFEGKEILPRSLKWNLKDSEGRSISPKNVRYSFEASDEEGPLWSEDSQLARTLKPRELMSRPPRYDSSAGQIVFMPQSDVKVAVKGWTLSLKAADGKILKVITGVGPVPKEFRFKPEELQTEGVNLESSASGAAMLQYSLVTVDDQGRQSAASDTFALDDEFGGEGVLGSGDYEVKKGKELLLLIKPNLSNSDPAAAKKASYLISVPPVQDLKSWRLELKDNSGRVIREFKGKGVPPAMLVWDGLDAAGNAALSPGAVSVALFATGLDGVEQKSSRAATLTRSFRYEGKGIKVQRVHAAWFAQGEAEIQAEMYGRLERVAEWLQKNASADILIQGHSSKEGDSKFNDRLALKRAEAVKAWLVGEKKVPESRITIKGYGNQLLLDQGDSEDAIRRNRRIDVLLLEWGTEPQ